MGKDPAVLFYTSDFMTGTAFMTYEEKGQYIHLLCLQHQMGHLSMDEIKSITNSGKVIHKFILCPDGKFHNERMHLEKEKRSSHREKQRQNIMKRWNRVGNTVVLPLEDRNENENKDVNKKKRIAKERKIFIKPSVEEIRAYCEERGNGIDAELFFHHYEACGWTVGKDKPMKAWKSSVITWEKNGFNPVKEKMPWEK